MKLRSTTVLAVLRDGKGAIGSDGQVTLGNTAVKHGAVKVRKLFGGKVLVGFAGGAADAFTLFEKFEGHLERYRGNLRRATVEMEGHEATRKALVIDPGPDAGQIVAAAEAADRPLDQDRRPARRRDLGRS